MGPISSSTGQLGNYNVETTIFSLGYKLLYKGLYAKLAFAKLDRDDRDLELTGDRARSMAVGYGYAFNQKVSTLIQYELLRNSNVKMSGFSIGALYHF